MKALKSIRRQEQLSKTYRAIRVINKPHLMQGGLSHILVTNSDGSLKQIDDAEEMNQALFERNRKHFAQAEGTPCTKPPLSEMLGYDGLTPIAHQILKGTVPSVESMSVQLLLNELNDQPPTISSNYDFEDMISGFANWKEQTTTSPSGKHLGIYKTLVKAHKLQVKTEAEQALPITTDPRDLLATKLLQIQNNI